MAINVYKCSHCGERAGYDSNTVTDIEKLKCRQCGEGSFKLIYTLNIEETADSPSMDCPT